MLYTDAKVSPKWEVNKADLEHWFSGTLEYLKPLVATVGLMYLAPILAALQSPGHVFTLSDFVPSQYVIGSIVLFLLNAAYGLLKRFADGKK